MAKTLSKFIKPDAMIILDHLSAHYLLYLILGGMLSVEVLTRLSLLPVTMSLA
jgi:hypothetical protein